MMRRLLSLLSLLSLLLMLLMLPTQRAVAITSLETPVLTKGYWTINWLMDTAITNQFGTFNSLTLVGEFDSAKIFFNFTGAFVNTNTRGAIPVNASCYSNIAGGAFCTISGPDKNRLIKIGHDGNAILGNVDNLEVVHLNLETAVKQQP